MKIVQSVHVINCTGSFNTSFLERNLHKQYLFVKNDKYIQLTPGASKCYNVITISCHGIKVSGYSRNTFLNKVSSSFCCRKDSLGVKKS